MEQWIQRNARLFGTLLLLIGVVAAYFFVYLPYAAIQAEEDYVSVGKAVFVVPIFIGFGLFYLLSGERAVELLGSVQKPTRLAYVLAFALGGIGFAAYIFLREQMKARGYG